MKKISLILSSLALLLIIWACSDLEHSNPFDPGSGSVTGLNNVELEILKIDQIKVIWDSDYFNVPGYTFQIDRKIGEHGVWQEKYKVFQKDVYFFTDSLAGIGQVNTYRVRVGYDQNLSEGVLDSVFNNFPSPTGVSLNRKDLNTVELRWSDNSNGEDGFIIDRYAGATWDDSLAIIDENTESWTDSTVSLNDSIKYRIWAYRKVTRSAAPESQWIDTTIPSPSNFTAQSLDLESVKISWTDNCIGEQGFKVDRKVGGGAWVSYYTAAADSTEWIDHNAVINETMQYRIYAYKGTDNSDIIVSNILENTFPAPTNLILNQMDLSTIRLDWKDNSDGEDGFVIDRKNSSGVWVNNVQLISGNTETWTDTPVVINDSLAYRIRGYKDTYYSAYSTATMSDITFPPPSNLAYQKMSLTSIKFTWTDNSVGEDSFIIDKKVGANEWTVSYATTAANATEWTDNSAQVNSDIQYRIYGKAGTNYSNYAVSEVIDNTVPSPSNLTYNKLDINSIRLNWTDNSNGETGFVIDRSVNGTWTNSFATAGSNATQWTDDSAVINSDLVYRIKAYYTTSYSITVETGIISNTFPAPSNITAQVTGMDITLNWTDNSIGEAGFKIDRKYDGGLWQDFYASVAANTITWNQTVADTGKYYYRVKAYSGTYLSATSAVAEAWAKQTENEMILVPAGTFQMGQVGVAEPVHEVTLTHSYYMAKYETTQKEWTDIMGSNPASGYGVGDNYPVYYVSWYDILVYCNKRSISEGLNPCYMINNSTNPNDWGTVPTAQDTTWDAVECRWYENGYRLPTEAEWEYAARYNDGRTYPWGETDYSTSICNYDGIGSTTPVGNYQYGKSQLGFYDMAGNVWEKVWDQWGDHTSDPQTDPTGYESDMHTLKGAAWDHPVGTHLKSANRSYHSSDYKIESSGFRVAKNNPADPRSDFFRTYGTSSDDEYANSMQQTTDGGYIICGAKYPYGSSDSNVFLLKTDANGKEIWQKIYGGNDSDVGYSVQQCNDGGYIILGHSRSFGTGSYDIYLIKTDSYGNESWYKTFGGEYSDEGYSVKQTSDGGYVICGETTSYGAGSSDVYLIKTDSSGNESWYKTFGGINPDHGFSVIQSNDSGYVICGQIAGDVCLIKTDSSGNESWNKTYGGSESDEGLCVQQTSDNGYIISGKTSSDPTDFGNLYLIKTDENGNETWHKTFGESGVLQEKGYSVKQTSDNGYIIAGSTTSYGAGVWDAYLIKTDSSGNQIWYKTFGGTNNDMAFDVLQTSDNKYVLTGYTESYGAGYRDAFLIKTDANGNVMGW